MATEVPESVLLYYDVTCEWCYLAWRWLREVEKRGKITIEYRPTSADFIASIGPDVGQDGECPEGDPLSRAAALVNRYYGRAGSEEFYRRVGKELFDRVPPATDWWGVAMRTLSAVDGDGTLCETYMTRARGDEREANAREVRTRFGNVGVPALALDGTGAGIFGPVLSARVSGSDAVTLWEHVRWLITCDNFCELKRRRRPADLNVARWRRAQKAAASLSPAEGSGP